MKRRSTMTPAALRSPALRSGRRPTSTTEPVGAIVASLTKPKERGIPIKRSQIGHPSSPRSRVDGSRRCGSASGPTRPSLNQGGRRRALHRAAGGQRRDLPGRAGAGPSPPGSRLKAGGRLGRGRGASGLRHPAQPEHPPSTRRAALRPGPPPLAVRLSADLRRRPQPDRAVVEASCARPSWPASGSLVGRRSAGPWRPWAGPPPPASWGGPARHAGARTAPTRPPPG